jgi:tRNA A-37 threonylcarbamoyl transferase component Bud32
VDNPEKHGTRTLVEMLRIKRKINISIDPTLCALLTSLDIAEALKFMHKSKTLHGDLKPHNILLVSTPSVRICLPQHPARVHAVGAHLFAQHLARVRAAGARRSASYFASHCACDQR